MPLQLWALTTQMIKNNKSATQKHQMVQKSMVMKSNTMKAKSKKETIFNNKGTCKLSNLTKKRKNRK